MKQLYPQKEKRMQLPGRRCYKEKKNKSGEKAALALVLLQPQFFSFPQIFSQNFWKCTSPCLFGASLSECLSLETSKHRTRCIQYRIQVRTNLNWGLCSIHSILLACFSEDQCILKFSVGACLCTSSTIIGEISYSDTDSRKLPGKMGTSVCWDRLGIVFIT